MVYQVLSVDGEIRAIVLIRNIRQQSLLNFEKSFSMLKSLEVTRIKVPKTD